MLTRRGFLFYMGIGTYSALRSLSASAAVFPLRQRATKPSLFSPISPSEKDQLLLPSGFKYDVLASYGDPLGSQGPNGAETFGYDNDFLSYFPVDILSGGHNPSHGLLWVNHEFVNPFLMSGEDRSKKRSLEALREEHQAVGGSILEIKRDGKTWQRVPTSKYSRRFTADYPVMRVTGPGKSFFSSISGTLANCSGGRTPWHTVLSCEENFQLFNSVEGFGLNWGSEPSMAIEEEKFGWVVEIDPFGVLPPTKHTALGRFSHENAALRLGAQGRLVVYMGDDEKDQYLYKYVSHERIKSSASREAQSALLENGTLYVANFAKGQWLPLDIKRNPALRSAGFKDQAQIVLQTRAAAQAVGATPLDRPEDCEVHPLDGSLYVSLTNNAKHGAVHGAIIRLVEHGDDAEAEKFQFEIFLAGGPQSGLSCPDNLLFDKSGNLWVACDISSTSLRSGCYEAFGNNGLFMVPTAGPAMGDAYQFASGPTDAELTGTWFNDTEDTLFLSVQHPGESTVDRNKPTSRWPLGSGLPKPSVVAITGFSSTKS